MSLEGERFTVVESFRTALDSASLDEGDVFKVREDQLPYEMDVSDECIEVIHESMNGRKDQTVCIVVKSEFIENTIPV